MMKSKYVNYTSFAKPLTSTGTKIHENTVRM